MAKRRSIIWTLVSFVLVYKGKSFFTFYVGFSGVERYSCNATCIYLLLNEVLDGPHKVNTSGIFNISEQVSF